MEDLSDHPTLVGLDFNILYEDQSVRHETFFLKMKLYQLWEHVGEKVTRPDDFPLWFYQMFWVLLMTNILQVFDDFRQSGFLEWRLNTSFFTLVLKEKGEK